MTRPKATGILARPALCLLVLGIWGCVGPTIRATPITEANRSLLYNGFSATAPVGAGWVLTPAHPPLTMGMGKRGASETNTLAMGITVGSLPQLPPGELFGMVEKAKEEEMRTGRFQPRSYKASRQRYREADCHRYDAEVEDHGVPKFKDKVFILEMHGLTCLHPEVPTAFVDIQYSQRRLATEEPVDITAEGEEFIRSLQFTAFGRETDALHAIVPIAEGMGRILFYRPGGIYRFVGAAQQPVIKVDGETVGRSVPGEAFYRDVSPGAHEIVVPVFLYPGETKQTVHVDVGETVYIRTWSGDRAVWGRTEVTVVDSATAKQELLELGVQ